MKLYEFFSKISLDNDQGKDRDPLSLNKQDEEDLQDEIYWCILDDNDLHKKYFLPIAKQLKQRYENHEDDSTKDWKEWIPMVNKGCAEYFKNNDLRGDPKDIFNNKVRRDICKRLEEHYRKAIMNDEYNLGH
jgi:hypothetical protein